MELYPSARPRILVVDDDLVSRTLLRESLSDCYDVTLCASGEDAITAVQEAPPDLILLDVMMNGLDGYEVCRILKASNHAQDIPVIFITSRVSQEDEVLGLNAGAVDYVVKPFRLPILKARVKTHLDLKRKTDLLESLSFRDGLTGLYNRRWLDHVLEAEWARAARNGRTLSLVMLDLDCFKAYNDHYGHLAGDECLKTVAQTITTAFRRTSDVAARYGGEEFAVVPTETPAENVESRAEHVRRCVEQLSLEHAFSAVTDRVTISVGVASVIPRAGHDPRELLEAADSALYRAKRRGRNCVCCESGCE